MLFLLFINDLHFTSNSVCSFADDSTLDNSSSFSFHPSVGHSESRIALSPAGNADPAGAIKT